jgi:hypothetical protein
MSDSDQDILAMFTDMVRREAFKERRRRIHEKHWGSYSAEKRAWMNERMRVRVLESLFQAAAAIRESDGEWEP